MAASGLSWPEGNLQFCVASLLEVESADKEGRQKGSSATGHGSVGRCTGLTGYLRYELPGSRGPYQPIGTF